MARWASGAVFFFTSTTGFLFGTFALLVGGSSSLELDRLAGLIDDIDRFMGAAEAAFWTGATVGGGLLLLVEFEDVLSVDWDETEADDFVSLASEIRRVGCEAAFAGATFLFAVATGPGLVSFEAAFGWPELLLRREEVFASCDEDDSESELDELLSDPLELPLDDDEPELDPELDSVEVVD